MNQKQAHTLTSFIVMYSCLPSRMHDVYVDVSIDLAIHTDLNGNVDIVDVVVVFHKSSWQIMSAG